MIDARIALIMAFAALSATPPSLWLAKADSSYTTPTRDGRERIQRTGACPTGYVGLGNKCEALHQDTPRAYPKIKGAPCPAATFASGDYCKALR
ncbi:hypothetical protein GGD66_005153 [Bradyrhizobium sp. CIR48]|nr:hypothetical protein [Bradyrhizobium sp. CIR48]